MFVLVTCLVSLFITEILCCESTTFQNTRIITSGKNNDNIQDAIITNCLEYNNETKHYANIEVRNQNLGKLQKGTFVNLPVTSLVLTNNVIKEIDKDTFQRLRSLQKLDLSKNQIKTIRKDVFNDLASLEILNLSENQISDIEELALAYLVILQELILNNNQIKVFNPQWFTGNNRLNKLNLENNLLEFIPESAFINAPALNSLTLRSNRLKEIHQDAFKSTTSLTSLDLSENNLTKLHKDTFASLSGRKIGEETNSRKSGLFAINFRPIFGLWTLYLHRNNLTYLPEEIMNDLTSNRGFKFITIYSNPWQCGCYRKIMKWVVKSRLWLNDVQGKGCYHSGNPVCAVPKGNPQGCVEEVEDDIRSFYYSIYKHYTSYDGADNNVSCNIYS